MEANYRYFCNEKCEYFPCHKGADPERFNCLFCYCPLYALGENCGGSFVILQNGRKDCTGCLFPHQPENYDAVCAKYVKICAAMEVNGTMKAPTDGAETRLYDALVELCEDYIKECREISESTSAFAGLFGLGKGPKKDHIHREFYERCGELTKQLADTQPSPETASKAAEYLLTRANTDPNRAGLTRADLLASGMFAAAESHVLPLIPYLPSEDAAKLLIGYEQRNPKNRQLPNQKKVAQALEKRAKEK